MAGVTRGRKRGYLVSWPVMIATGLLWACSEVVAIFLNRIWR